MNTKTQDFRQRRARRRNGFTLVELLVVLVILGMLALIAVPQVMNYLDSAKVDAARVQIERIGGVLDLYRLDTGSYPSSEHGLDALVDKPAGAERWNGPYLKNRESLIDPWGNPYEYRFPGDHGAYDLYSLGADGQEGGDDDAKDLTSW